MKIKHSIVIGVLTIIVFSSCNKTNKKGLINESVWAELVESKTLLIKPEGWDDEYWNSVNKNVDREKIFKTIVEAVLSGKQKAYNIITDQVLTVEQVQDLLNNIQLNNMGEMTSQKITPEDLSTIRMREKWTFDENAFKIHKEVTRIDLLLKKLDQTGGHIGDKALFYVNLKE
jgi:hypothetical protein